MKGKRSESEMNERDEGATTLLARFLTVASLSDEKIMNRVNKR